MGYQRCFVLGLCGVGWAQGGGGGVAEGGSSTARRCPSNRHFARQVPYFTVLDVYMILSMFFLVAIMVENAIIASVGQLMLENPTWTRRKPRSGRRGAG